MGVGVVAVEEVVAGEVVLETPSFPGKVVLERLRMQTKRGFLEVV